MQPQWLVFKRSLYIFLSENPIAIIWAQVFITFQSVKQMLTNPIMKMWNRKNENLLNFSTGWIWLTDMFFSRVILRFQYY